MLLRLLRLLLLLLLHISVSPFSACESKCVVCTMQSSLHIVLQARVHMCRAKDSSAQSASAWRLVQVQQQYAVTLTLPLSLPASDSADAQTKADALMSGGNATGALATALSAGLIAGQPALRFLPTLTV